MTAAQGETATFTCCASGYVAWAINGVQIESSEQAEVLDQAGITVPYPPTSSQSSVVISVFESLNETTVQCLVLDPDDLTSVAAYSDTVTLIVSGNVVWLTVLIHSEPAHKKIYVTNFEHILLVAKVTKLFLPGVPHSYAPPLT